jgi:hypothetical protein
MTDASVPSRRSQIRSLAVVAALAALCLAPGARAGILYDFSFSFEQYSASGTLVLSDTVGVGEEFSSEDVELYELELFNDSSSVGAAEFPPFEGFGVVEGTRNASSLSMSDLVVSEPFGIIFGCTASDCLFTGEIFFTSAPGGRLEIGTPQAALDSFVFIEVPEPNATALFAAALTTVAGLCVARSSRSAEGSVSF